MTKQKIIRDTLLRNSQDEVEQDAGLLSMQEQEEFLGNIFAELEEVEDGRLQLLEQWENRDDELEENQMTNA